MPILLVLAAVCFLLATCRAPIPKVDLTACGLFLATLHFLAPNIR